VYLEGRIYISSAFINLPGIRCRPNAEWLDNDPHIWNSPPTWGICRTDFRRMLTVGDYIFFVLPKHGELPQMIYAYFKIREHIDHKAAFMRFPQKRMWNGSPNGNIIVNSRGEYNRYDMGIHEDRFDQVKEHYLVGSWREGKRLSRADICRLAPSLLRKLNGLFLTNARDIFEVIGRKGRILDAAQVKKLLRWIDN
jgi:hypothetical protein